MCHNAGLINLLRIIYSVILQDDHRDWKYNYINFLWHLAKYKQWPYKFVSVENIWILVPYFWCKSKFVYLGCNVEMWEGTGPRRGLERGGQFGVSHGERNWVTWAINGYLSGSYNWEQSWDSMIITAINSVTTSSVVLTAWSNTLLCTLLLFPSCLVILSIFKMCTLTIQIFCPFPTLTVSCCWVLMSFILDINLLWDIFCCYVGLSSIVLLVLLFFFFLLCRSFWICYNLICFLVLFPVLLMFHIKKSLLCLCYVFPYVF